jgi:hypothetical protein
MLRFSSVSKKSSKDAVSLLQPSSAWRILSPANSEPESLISLRCASERTGNQLSPNRLRGYALDGSIPGARQVRKGKQWFFKELLFEKWWQEFNGPKPGES